MFVLLRFVRRPALLPLRRRAVGVFEWTLSLARYPRGTLAAGQYLSFPPSGASLLGSYFVTLVIVTGCGYRPCLCASRQRRLLAAGCAFWRETLPSARCCWRCPPVRRIPSAPPSCRAISEPTKSGQPRGEILALYASLTEQAAQAGAELILLPRPPCLYLRKAASCKPMRASPPVRLHHRYRRTRPRRGRRAQRASGRLRTAAFRNTDKRHLVPSANICRSVAAEKAAAFWRI
ncbi:MAG: hypothetical protein ACLUFV_12835 [Acutalibacteraceae bacterium]